MDLFYDFLGIIWNSSTFCEAHSRHILDVPSFVLPKGSLGLLWTIGKLFV